MKIITAPDDCRLDDYNEKIFLAGGITDCDDWQTRVLGILKTELTNWDTSELAIFNPRRGKFPIDDPSAAEEQIAWEFRMLQACDIFTMYFCNGPSDQPICMYELGRNIVRMQQKYPKSWRNRIVVSIEDGYKRSQDVIIQCRLAGLHVIPYAAPFYHAQAIVNAWAILYGQDA